MKTASPPIFLFLHLFAAATHYYQPALSFQLPMSPLHKDNNINKGSSSMQHTDDRVVTPQSSTIVDLSECFSDQCWNNDCGDSQDTAESGECINHFVPTKNNDNDVFWSIFSNAFFLGGGLFYIIGSSWDVSLSNLGSDPQNMFLYYSIWILGPFVYLLNSCIDVIWAVRTVEAEKKQRGERD
jgi:hypothetical protein